MQEVDRAAFVIGAGSDQEVVAAIAVDVAQPSKGATQLMILGGAEQANRRISQCDLPRERAVEDIDGASALAAAAVLAGPDGDVVVAVAVDVTQSRDRAAGAVRGRMGAPEGSSLRRGAASPRRGGP